MHAPGVVCCLICGALGPVILRAPFRPRAPHPRAPRSCAVVAMNIGQGLSGRLLKRSKDAEARCRFLLDAAYEGAYLAALCATTALPLPRRARTRMHWPQRAGGAEPRAVVASHVQSPAICLKARGVDKLRCATPHHSATPRHALRPTRLVVLRGSEQKEAAVPDAGGRRSVRQRAGVDL